MKILPAPGTTLSPFGAFYVSENNASVASLWGASAPQFSPAIVISLFRVVILRRGHSARRRPALGEVEGIRRAAWRVAFFATP